MLKQFYKLVLLFVLVICCAGSISADNNDLLPSTGRKVYVPITAKSVKGQVHVFNYGNGTIHDFDYTLSFNGVILASKHHVFPQPLSRQQGAMIEVDVPPHTEYSETDLLFTITKVNGETNSAATNYATLPRVTVSKIPRRRVVVEEYTGMWCRYCPSGIALMENLAHNYPDDFIGIAVHTGGYYRYDPLACADYSAKAAEFPNRPTVSMNRTLPLSYFIARSEFETERDGGAAMDIDVSAVWDEKKNNITVTPRVTFRLNRQDAPYGFAYVLTEDGMSNPSWTQQNDYSGETRYRGISKELDYFIDAPFVVRNLENNFVAIAAEGVKHPLTGNIKAPIVADEEHSHEYVFKNISSKTVIQDKSKLTVCVLLINTKTGQIENAAKCRISDAATTAITTVPQGQDSVVETARYTLDGRRITTPQKGVNIVKYSDGRVRKEVVTR